MSDLLQAVLTFAANAVGFVAAALIVVHSVRRHGGSWVKGVPAAATALLTLWLLILAWYFAAKYQLLEGGEDGPAWLEASVAVAENQQSEVWQVWLAALVFKWLRWPGSPESR